MYKYNDHLTQEEFHWWWTGGMSIAILAIVFICYAFTIIAIRESTTELKQEIKNLSQQLEAAAISAHVKEK